MLERFRWSAPLGLVAVLVCCLGSEAQAETACTPGRDLLSTLDASARAAIDAEAMAQANGEGRLWRIEKPGQAASHLFGTLHLTDPRVTRLPDSVRSAFDAADEIVIESTELSDPDRIAATLMARPDLMSLPRGRVVGDYLPEGDRAELARRLDAAGTPAASVQTLQPWFLATSLMMPACEQARLAEGEQILDLALADAALRQGKTLSGLESAQEQLEALASLPLETQAEMLMSTLSHIDIMPDLFETMTQLYLAGRIAAIVPAAEHLAPSGTTPEGAAEVWQAFDERIVRRRNHLMAERMEPILARGNAFIAVGAQHLIGDEGLVALLRATGWTVTRADGP